VRRNLDLKGMAKSFRTVGLALGLAVLPLVAAGCSHKADAEEKKSLVEVGTISPERRDLTRVVYQPGYLRPYEMTPIFTKIAGFANEPKFDIGDHVKKGELLVELRVPEVVQDLNVKKAKVKQAEADLKQAKESALAAKAAVESAQADVQAKLASIRSAEAQVMRWKAEEVRSRKLVLDGVYDQQTADEVINQFKTSEAVLDEVKAKHRSSEANKQKATANFNKAEADVEVAAASILVAEAMRDQWKAWLDYAQITAPFDGVITDRIVHTDHFLQPSNSGSTSKSAIPLFVMMRTDIMRCTVDVPELDALLVRRGDKAVVNFQAIPGVDFVAEVTRTSKALDEHTRTLRVEIWLKNASGASITYSASADGVITSVQPTPRTGGAGYPPNATFPLQIVCRDKMGIAKTAADAKQSEMMPSVSASSSGRGAIVNATTDASGAVVRCTLVAGGSNYVSGVGITGHTHFAREFRPNMYANVSILPKVRNAWMLPPDAVLSDILANGDRRYCFILEDEGNKKIARKVFLEVGSLCEEGLQILRKQRVGQKDWEEVTGKEAVVTTNNKALQDGQEVQLQASAVH
jgi:HlyD family secretion protein